MIQRQSNNVFVRASRRFVREVRAAEETLIGFERGRPGSIIAQSIWEPENASDYCQRCGASLALAFRNGLAMSESSEGVCIACENTRAIGAGVVRLGVFEPPLSEWICAVKYARWESMGHALGVHLGNAIAARVPELRGRGVVIPIPMPRARRRVRGIDHARVIAQGVGEALGIRVRQPLIQRAGATQVGRSRSARHRRKSPFELGWFSTNLAGQRVVLVDDVLTSGRTARSAIGGLEPLHPGPVLFSVLAMATANFPTNGRKPATDGAMTHCQARPGKR